MTLLSHAMTHYLGLVVNRWVGHVGDVPDPVLHFDVQHKRHGLLERNGCENGD